MLSIYFKNGENVHFKYGEEYIDFQYDDTFFILIRDGQIVSLFNIDSIKCIHIQTFNYNKEEKENDVV